MPIEKQSAQARINGAKSEGPKNPVGKARSSIKSLRHGRYANHAIVLSNEDKDAVEDLADAHIRRIGPLDSVETRFAPELAFIDWPLTRNRAVENLLYARQNALSSLQRFGQAHRLSQLCSQAVDPKPLNPEFDPRSEPGANPA